MLTPIRPIAALLIAFCLATAAHAVPLFNGVDLTGWTKLGGNATYHVENGEIVGRSAPSTPNTFLVTQSAYVNFELELNFKISDTSFNSGVQIRSQSLPSHNNGRVFGYQVEIDPLPSRAWSGGLYFEGGSPNRSAGWLDDLSDNPAARAAFMLGQWNHFRIRAVDRRIQTWINDVPAADFTDNHATGFLPSGFIGLQVHSINGNPPTPYEVRWRDIELSEMAPPPSTLALIVDPLTGMGRITNPTGASISFDSYTISSNANSLRPANGAWLSLDDQNITNWSEASVTPSALSELEPFGSLALGPGASPSLGGLFNPGGVRDLRFEYGVHPAPLPTMGAVLYEFAADFDDDGEVERFDLERWRAGFGPAATADADLDGDTDGTDFLVWQRQQGAALAPAATAATAIPEPAAPAMLAGILLSTAALMEQRGRRRGPIRQRR